MEKLTTFLAGRSEKERDGLRQILKVATADPVELSEALQMAASGLLEAVIKPPTYYQIVQKVGRRLKLRMDDGDPVEELEKRIAQRIVQEMWGRMTASQREQFEQELRKAAGELDLSGILAAGSLYAAFTAAHISGFGVYLLTSTALSALTGAAGITLPFAAYTALSRGLGFLLGPIGWVGVGLFTGLQLTAPKWKQTTAAIVYIAMLRNAPLKLN